MVSAIRDRVVGLRRVRAGDLIPHPRNWRKHPERQAQALAGVLAEVGYAGALIVRETADGLQLIDGHLRAETTPDAVVPVLVVDVTEEEADKLLATLDPLAAMAEADAEVLAGLLATVNSESEAVREMLARLAHDSGAMVPDFGSVGLDEQGRLDERAPVRCPECGHEFTP